MRVEFTFDYNNRMLTADEQERLRRVLPTVTFSDDGKPQAWMPYVADLNSLYEAIPDAKIEITSLKGEDVPRLLTDTILGLEALATKLNAPPQFPQHMYNERVSVHVPGLGLLAIDEVEVVTDYCTEKLQEMLDKGWRILAVCPQPDQRRPDYILGRSQVKGA